MIHFSLYIIKLRICWKQLKTQSTYEWKTDSSNIRYHRDDALAKSKFYQNCWFYVKFRIVWTMEILSIDISRLEKAMCWNYRSSLPLKALAMRLWFAASNWNAQIKFSNTWPSNLNWMASWTCINFSINSWFPKNIDHKYTKFVANLVDNADKSLN